jgi:hypothetical protein
MDHEILVNEFRKILQVVKHEQVAISLFMLKALDADVNMWNLIVSSLEYDPVSTKKAVQQIIHILNTHLKKSLLKSIIRVTILKTSDPFVEEINRVFPVTHGVKHIQSSVISGVYIEKAIIFESRVVPSLNTPKRSLNESVPV